jgi:Family of unknown function (DUF5686)/CarboxypepD_reg-like domain
MQMKRILLFLIYFSIQFVVSAQLTGKIADSKGNNLPFANIYIENTTIGTTSNADGYYTLDIPNGSYQVVFSFVGYKTKSDLVTVTNKTTLNVQLESSDYELTELTIRANAEDPAYAIIRNAIARRKAYFDLTQKYSCDVYIKGIQKVANMPKKILGQEIGDMDGMIDTATRSGILYLCETISKYYVNGKDKKEELFSSKESGDNNGFGFNRASLFDFSFYDDYINIRRQILTPIGDNALGFSKFKLLGSFYEKDGSKVYKIQVIPKQAEYPTWAGIIYIYDNQYNIHSTDLYVTGKSIQQDVLDTLRLRQSFVPVDGVFRIFSQAMEFKFSLLGIKIKGNFNSVYSHYNTKPDFPKGFFGSEVFKATKQKDDNDLAKWDSIRPIPLTQEEARDYVKKDSLMQVHHTRAYVDSVSRKSNSFGPFNLLLGYTYNDDWNQRNLSIKAPIASFGFNPVQGGNLTLDIKYRQDIGIRFEEYKRTYTIAPLISYGLAEKKLRTAVNINYLLNRFNYSRIEVEGGQNIAQFNSQNPVSKWIFNIYSLFRKEHYVKIYDKLYLKANYGTNIANGLRMNIEAEAAQRSPLDINSQFSFNKKQDRFNNNLPDSLQNDWPISNAYTIGIGLSWTPGQKYITYPHARYNQGSVYPTFTINYTKAIPLETEGIQYDKLLLKIKKNNIKLGIAGFAEINAEYGTFLTKKNVAFMDLHHFNGNETVIATDQNFMQGFFQLPFYRFSTKNDYFSAHWQHHLEGYLLDRIPLIRKLAFKEIIRVAYLYTPKLDHYAEFGFGIDNIGFNIYRFFSINLSWKVQNGVVDGKPLVMFGIKI